MDELKSLNLTLGFYFLKNLKNLNSDFLGFLGLKKKPKKPRFFKAMSNSPAPQWGMDLRRGIFWRKCFFVGGGHYFWRRSILLEEVYFFGGSVFLLEEVIIFGGGRFCWRRCIFWRKCFFVGGGDVCFWSRVALTGHRIIHINKVIQKYLHETKIFCTV